MPVTFEVPDRGSQYASDHHRSLLDRHGITTPSAQRLAASL